MYLLSVSLLCISLLFICRLTVAHEGDGHEDPMSGNINGGVNVGDATLYIETESYVWHMERDILHQKNLLFSDGNALKTSDGVTTSTIIGNATISGYINAVGAEARFQYITGFIQLDARRVIVVDNGNNCVRLVDRVTRTAEPLVGQCSRYGYVDGVGDQALFAGPWSIVQDQSDHNVVIVTDRYNNALRSIDLRDNSVSTLHIGGGLYRPRAFIWSEKELWITGYTNITSFSVEKKRVSLIAGSVIVGDNDGDLETVEHRNTTLGKLFSLSSANGQPPTDNPAYLFRDLPKFKDILEIVSVDKGVFLVVDRGNGKLRLLDTTQNSVSSICDGEDGRTCRVLSPAAILSLGDNVYIGDYRSIKRLPVCVSRNVSIRLHANETAVNVELSPGRIITLGPGYHVYTIRNKPEETCTRYINVYRHHQAEHVGSSNALQLSQCPDRIIRIGSTVTNEASVQLTLDDGTNATITLPVGTYPYHMVNEVLDCNLTVNIYDYRLSRRLEFQADYNISCDAMDDDTTSLIEKQAGMGYKQIEIVCGEFCGRSENADPILRCVDDILTIRWPTDVSYKADIIIIPGELAFAVNEALIERGPFLNMVIPTIETLVIYPEKFDEGYYCEIILTPQCVNGTAYNLDTDSCYD